MSKAQELDTVGRRFTKKELAEILTHSRPRLGCVVNAPCPTALATGRFAARRVLARRYRAGVFYAYATQRGAC